MKKKALVVLTVVAVLLVASVGATMAWLTDQTNELKNTFTIGHIDLTLDEKDLSTGAAADARTETGNEYKLLPGVANTKDPIVHVQMGSEPCWVFVRVDNGLATFEGAATIESQILANGWKALAEVPGVYYKEAAVDASAAQVDLPVFQSFTLKSDIADADYTVLANQNILVKAFACQEAEFVSPQAVYQAHQTHAFFTVTP